MSVEVTINGVSREVQSLTISQSQNNRDRATLRWIVPVGTTPPAIDDELIVTEDGTTRLFGGTVKQPSMSGIEGDPTVPWEVSVNALDFNELGDRQVVMMTIPSGTTLKAAVNLLLPYLPGVTNTMAVNGPALPELTYDVVTVTKVLDDLSQNTGWLRNINYYKELSFWEPGTWDAPWDIEHDDGHCVGDVTVTESRTDYANQVIVRFSEAARTAYQFLGQREAGVGANFRSGEEVTLGSTTYRFVTSAPFESHDILIAPDGNTSLAWLAIAITDGGEGHDTIMSTSISPHSSCVAYDMGRPTPMMVAKAREPGDSGNNIACSTTSVEMFWYGEGGIPHDTLYLGSDQSLTNKVTVNDSTQQALYGIYTRVVDAPSIFNATDATALGTQALQTFMVVEREIQYETYDSGLFPGMTQWIEVAYRDIDESCLITAIEYRLEPGSYERRRVTAVSGQRYDGSKWRDLYKAWLGSSGSGSTMTFNPNTGGTAILMGPVIAYLGGSRFHAVQIP